MVLIGDGGGGDGGGGGGGSSYATSVFPMQRKVVRLITMPAFNDFCRENCKT